MYMVKDLKEEERMGMTCKRQSLYICTQFTTNTHLGPQEAPKTESELATPITTLRRTENWNFAEWVERLEAGLDGVAGVNDRVVNTQATDTIGK